MYSEPAREIIRRISPQFSVPPPSHVTRSDCHVGARLGGGDQPRNVARVVGEVAVHLEHELGALGERPVEPGDVGAPEPFLALAVEDGHPLQLLSEPVGEVAGAVRRAVVDHEDAAAIRQHIGKGAHHAFEVLDLVVGREADRCAHLLIIAVWP